MDDIQELTAYLRSEAKALSSSFSNDVFGPLFEAADALDNQSKTIAAYLEELGELNKQNHWLLSEASKLEASLTEQKNAYVTCASKRDALIDEVEALKTDLASYMRIAESEANYRVKLEDALLGAIKRARENTDADVLKDYILDHAASVCEIKTDKS